MIPFKDSFSLLDNICFIEAFRQVETFFPLDILVKIYLICHNLVFYGPINLGKRLKGDLANGVRKIRSRVAVIIVFFSIRHVYFMNIIEITENSQLNNNQVPFTVV